MDAQCPTQNPSTGERCRLLATHSGPHMLELKFDRCLIEHRGHRCELDRGHIGAHAYHSNGVNIRFHTDESDQTRDLNQHNKKLTDRYWDLRVAEASADHPAPEPEYIKPMTRPKLSPVTDAYPHTCENIDCILGKHHDGPHQYRAYEPKLRVVTDTPPAFCGDINTVMQLVCTQPREHEDEHLAPIISADGWFTWRNHA